MISEGAGNMVDGSNEHRFGEAVRYLGAKVKEADLRLQDGRVNLELRAWLDGDDPPMEWTIKPGPGVTADEWFFISTLYGEMTLAGQRSHIRKHFQPLFVVAARRDIRNFHPDRDRGAFSALQSADLRSGWMKRRLVKMAEILLRDDLDMDAYSNNLREQESKATPADPTPALDTIVRDHQATGWKTLSVFVRDCVGGNCFPIDSRVAKVLDSHSLPHNERLLVELSLKLGLNPRQVARLFYAGA
jgi:hypothetical protein